MSDWATTGGMFFYMVIVTVLFLIVALPVTGIALALLAGILSGGGEPRQGQDHDGPTS